MVLSPLLNTCSANQEQGSAVMTRQMNPGGVGAGVRGESLY